MKNQNKGTKEPTLSIVGENYRSKPSLGVPISISNSFISLLIYYISFVVRAMANFYKGALLRLKAFSGVCPGSDIVQVAL
jgi:hypothetical protein